MKKFLPYILMTVFLLTIMLGPFGARTAEAGLVDFLGLGVGGGIKLGIVFILSLIAYIIFFAPAVGILFIAGQLFDNFISLSLSNEYLNHVVVDRGWTIVRDVANLFFIFILLYISIAAILRLTTHGTKEILTKVVIVALLINFSLPITKVVIDVSNVLALEFYNAITIKDSEINLLNTTIKTKNLSGAFIANFNPQNIFNSASFGEMLKEDNTDTFDTTLSISLFFLFAAGFILIIAFVLLAATALFLIRTIYLMILMILAPLAFIGWILPETSQYSKLWWNNLLSQAFFAPAFLFFFYLATQLTTTTDLFTPIIENGLLGGRGGVQQTFNVILVTFFPFAIAGSFLIFSLITARSIGAYGATALMSWGQSGAKWARGSAGNYAKRIGAQGSEAARERLENKKDKEGKIIEPNMLLKGIRKIPGVHRGLALGAQRKTEEIKGFEKQYGSYPTATLKQLKGSAFTSREAKTAMEKIIKRNEEKTLADENKEIKRLENKGKLDKINKRLEKIKEISGKDTETNLSEIETELASLQGQTEERAVTRRAKLFLQEKEITRLITQKESLEDRMARTEELDKTKKELEGKINSGKAPESKKERK